MDPLNQTGLQPLMNISSGHRDVVIGVIDGPVDLSHPAFQGSARIRTAKHCQLNACKNASDLACLHGTFVAGILCAKRGCSAPAICPDCETVFNPIFRQDKNNKNHTDILPSVTPEELSNAIIDTVDAGAKIINLSLGLSTSSLTVYNTLQQAYDYALQKDVILIAAAGNQGNIGNVSLINHQWVIPVASCNEESRLDPTSNFGRSIGGKGLMAPGVNIMSAQPGGKYTLMSGTSFATPFVTGAIALLWSIFKGATAGVIIHALTTSVLWRGRRSIIPPLLNAEAAYVRLKNLVK